MWFDKLKSKLPTQEVIQNHKLLRFMKKYLDRTEIWLFTQGSVARAALIGLFWAMIPMPFQMVPAAIFAVLLRANIIIAVAGVWVSNPFTMVPLLYASYRIGCILLNLPVNFEISQLSMDHLFSNIHLFLAPIYLGSVIVGILAGTAGFLLSWLIFSFKPVN